MREDEMALTDAQIDWLGARPEYCPCGRPRPGVSFRECGTLYADGRFEASKPMKPILLEPGCILVGVPSDLYPPLPLPPGAEPVSNETKNAIIRSARITVDEYGLLSSWLDLDYGGSGQAFGGYCLYLPTSFSHHDQSLQANFAGHFIWRVMEIADVTEWIDLIGKTIRVKAEHSRVHAIGHIVKDDWFSPAEDFARMSPLPTREPEGR